MYTQFYSHLTIVLLRRIVNQIPAIYAGQQVARHSHDYNSKETKPFTSTHP